MHSLQQFDQLKADITLKVAPTMKITVADRAGVELALDAGHEVKQFIKRVEETRKALVKPLQDEEKRINDYAKSILAPVKEAETYLKSELQAFEKKCAQERLEEQIRLEAERRQQQQALADRMREEKERAEMEAAFGLKSDADLKRDELVAQATLEREQAEIASHARADEKIIAANKVSGARRIWKFEVKDASKVPAQYLTVDLKKIKEAMAEGIHEIPGVHIYQETTIALR